MKTSTRSLLAEFLHEQGALATPSLGPRSNVTPTQESVELFRAKLEGAARRSRRLSAIVVTAHVGVLAIGAALLLRRPVGQPLNMAVLGGGSVLVLGLLRALRAVWRDAATLDLLLVVFPSLQPPEVLHVIESLYYGRYHE